MNLLEVFLSKRCNEEASNVCRTCDVSYCYLHALHHDKLHVPRENGTIWLGIPARFKRFKSTGHCNNDRYPANALHGAGQG